MTDQNKFAEICREDISALFPTVPERANKGSMGRVLLVCGSYDGHGAAMCGAAFFSSMAAYRCGAGIVEIFTHRKNFGALASLCPEAVFSLYDTDAEDIRDICVRLADKIRRADSVVLGCGLGKSDLAIEAVKTTLESTRVPLVIDADGLNILAENDNLWAHLSSEQRKMTVITPHMGEMSRLCGKSIEKILSSPIEVAAEYAKSRGIICHLKDHNTVITDENITYINHTGNAGMATGGMGDVLSGIIGALLARKTVADWVSNEKRDLPPVLYRTATAAYIHGLAGNRAAEIVGEYSLIASDLLKTLPEIIKENR